MLFADVQVTLREIYGLPKDIALHLVANYGTRSLQVRACSVFLSVSAWLCVCMCACMHPCMYVWMYVPVCMHVCMYVCMYACMYVLQIAEITQREPKLGGRIVRRYPFTFAEVVFAVEQV